MNKYLFFAICSFSGGLLYSQQVDSISFHLYTDSLKKGQHNYINIDGKLSNGKWMPLTEKEVEFSSSHAVFKGNDLVLPHDFKPLKITIKAVLKSNRAIWKEKTIWIKQLPDPKLPTRDEIMNPRSKRSKKG